MRTERRSFLGAARKSYLLDPLQYVTYVPWYCITRITRVHSAFIVVTSARNMCAVCELVQLYGYQVSRMFHALI